VAAETSETNNTKYKSYTFKPDLTISSLTGPSTTVPGATITLTDITKNSGFASAPATTTSYYLSANNSWSADDEFLASRTVGELTAGATNTGSISVTIPASKTGTIYIIAKADSANVAAETSETNNTKYKSYTFKPDLTISSLTGPSKAAPGATITMTDITKNSGAVTSSGTTTSYYLSANNSWSADDEFLASRTVGELTVGATNTGSVSVTIPASRTGALYIIAKADSANVVAETSETNNTKNKSIFIEP
jgi:subtilase family serine protease